MALLFLNFRKPLPFTTPTPSLCTQLRFHSIHHSHSFYTQLLHHSHSSAQLRFHSIHHSHSLTLHPAAVPFHSPLPLILHPAVTPLPLICPAAVPFHSPLPLPHSTPSCYTTPSLCTQLRFHSIHHSLTLHPAVTPLQHILHPAAVPFHSPLPLPFCTQLRFHSIHHSNTFCTQLVHYSLIHSFCTQLLHHSHSLTLHPASTPLPFQHSLTLQPASTPLPLILHPAVTPLPLPHSAPS